MKAVDRGGTGECKTAGAGICAPLLLRLLSLPLLFWFRLLYFRFCQKFGLHLGLCFLEDLLLHFSSEGLSSLLLMSHSLFERFSVILSALKTREAMELFLVRYLEVVVLSALHLEM